MCTSPEQRVGLKEVEALRKASRLTCAGCGKTVAADNETVLFDQGWRVVDGKALCALDHNIDLTETSQIEVAR